MDQIITVANTEVRLQGRLLRVGKIRGDRYMFINDPQQVIAGLRVANVRVDVFSFIQRLPHVTPEYDYPMEWDNFAALRIDTFERWWNEQIGFKARNKAKQAEKKGVVIREVPFSDELVKGIQTIYNESPVRQGHKNLHFGKDFETVYREEATFLDKSVFIGAFAEGSLIGFIKLVQDQTGTQAGLMNIVSMIRHRDKAPTNALVAHAVRACANRGIQFLVYSNFAYGKKQQSSLTDFKERNGFKKVDVPRYYVPLTKLGAVALKFGLHRRLVDHLPEAIVARLREVRAAWYNRQMPQVGRDN